MLHSLGDTLGEEEKQKQKMDTSIEIVVVFWRMERVCFFFGAKGWVLVSLGTPRWVILRILELAARRCKYGIFIYMTRTRERNQKKSMYIFFYFILFMRYEYQILLQNLST